MMNLGSGRKPVEDLNEYERYQAHQNHHNKAHNFRFEAVLLVLIFSVVSLSSLVLYNWAGYIGISPNPLGHKHFPNEASSSAAPAAIPVDASQTTKEGEDELEKMLKKAASIDRTVIITTLNAAWTSPNSVFDLFLESFRIGNQTLHLLDHLLVVAFDQTAYSRCMEVHSYCYALPTNGVNFTGEAQFRSSKYLEMMWARIDFLRHILEKGYNFVFTDTDIMWLRNPFSRFHSDSEFQIACDVFNSNSSDLNNKPNGGFNYVKSSRRTVQFYKFWYSSKDLYPGSHDQDVLNNIKFHPFIAEIGLQITFLPTVFYSGFCQLSDDLNLVITVHANCCVGLEKKIRDLGLVLDVWREYISDVKRRVSRPLSWGLLPQYCLDRNISSAPM
ncbi:unnamed protein product [Cuscuta epithymum]|uniref:Glycosyltransferase n=1 Tax=Cuscuta epithymum TaxID=186058 RepID=A0AAV0DT15_9ASTE|nr:unnamed protein product [Cuscuta epithymum]